LLYHLVLKFVVLNVNHVGNKEEQNEISYVALKHSKFEEQQQRSIISIAKITPPEQSKISKLTSSKSNSMLSRNIMRINFLLNNKFPI
jgi:hypothetical protein